jgi:hypothetical protein
MVGHKKNTQADAGEMHEDSMAEESTPALKMPEKGVGVEIVLFLVRLSFAFKKKLMAPQFNKKIIYGTPIGVVFTYFI